MMLSLFLLEALTTACTHLFIKGSHHSVNMKLLAEH